MTGREHSKGFTLIETLVAIGLLGSTFAAFVSMTVYDLRALRLQKNKIVAARIATEGIEFLINKRDNNLRCLDSEGACTLPCDDWRFNIASRSGNSCTFGNQPESWQVDAARSSELVAGSAFPSYSSTNFLCIETVGQNTGTFTYCGNDAAKMLPQRYTREVKVTGIAVDKVRVQSIVTWQEPLLGTRSVTLEQILFGGI